MLNLDLDKTSAIFRVIENENYWLFGIDHTVQDLTEGKGTYLYWYSAKCAIGHITIAGNVLSIRFGVDGDVNFTKSANDVIVGKPEIQSLASSVIAKLRKEYPIVEGYPIKTLLRSGSENTISQTMANLRTLSVDRPYLGAPRSNYSDPSAE